MTRSLSSRLMFILLAMTAIGWITFSYIEYRSARHSVFAALDEELEQTARAALAFALHEMSRVDSPGALRDSMENWLHLSQTVLRPGTSHNIFLQINLLDPPLAVFSGQAPDFFTLQDENGHSTVQSEDRQWRIYRYNDDDDVIVVYAAQPTSEYDLFARQMTTYAITRVIVILLILAILLWVSIYLGLRPMRIASNEVRKRKPGDFTPVSVKAAPTEVRTLLGGINNLMARVERLVDSERQFTSNASHELKTPLAGIRAQLQTLPAIDDLTERQQAYDRLIQAVDRITHVINQLLMLARLAPEEPHSSEKQVDLVRLVVDMVAESAPAAMARNIELGYLGEQQATVEGERVWLEVLVSNLVNNAISYTDPGGQITVAVKALEKSVRLEVVDTGSGIPPEQQALIFERFFRGDQKDDVSGSGIGLSIVKRIAEIHAASILVQSPVEGGRGTAITVDFPLEG